MRNLSSELRGSYAFGRFRLSGDGTLLVRDGVPVALAPKILQTLLVLVQRAGEVVRKGDLLQAVWPDSFVEETGLSRNISLLRRALADDAQTIIVTVARIGYRFAAPVVVTDLPAGSSRILDEVTRGTGEQTARTAGRLEAAHHQESQPEARRPTRLLILPFRLLRDDPDIGFLAFSVPDAVVNALTGLESLVVRSSAVASRFSGEMPDLSRIATEADVEAVVTGTLVRAGDQIRMNAQLVAVPCGTVRWSQSIQVPVRSSSSRTGWSSTSFCFSRCR